MSQNTRSQRAAADMANNASGLGRLRLNRTQKKELENEYLSLNRKVTDFREKGVDSDDLDKHTKFLTETIQKANYLSQNAYAGIENKCIGIDADLLVNISSAHALFSDCVKTDGLTFDIKQFAKQLVKRINPDAVFENEVDDDGNEVPRRPSCNVSTLFADEDLKRFARKYCNKLNHEAPPFDFLLGSMDIQAAEEEQPREERKRRERVKHNFTADDGNKSKPRVQGEDADKDDVVTVKVEQLYEKIKTEHRITGDRPLPYFATVVDKEDFSRTVTNIFHSAFLTKDGSVSIMRNEDGVEVMTPVRDEEGGHVPNADASRPRKQSVLSFNRSDWLNWISQQR